MGSVTTTPFGTRAIEALGRLLDEVRAGDPLAPALVVCGRPLVAAGVRRALGRRPAGIAGVDVVTTGELLRRLARPDLARLGHHVPSTIEVQAAIGAELAHRPGAFGALGTHRSTEERLVALHRVLGGVDAATLDRLQAAGSPLAADAIRVVRNAADRAGSARLDDGIVAFALDRLAQIPEGSQGPIVVFLPEPATPAEVRLVGALARRPDTEIVVGLTGVAPIDRRHVVRLAACSIQVVATTRGEVGSGLATVIDVADPGDEVRAALADVTAHAALGVPLNRMAVLYTDDDPYGALLGEQLGAAGLPWCGPGRRPLAATVTGRFLLGLLDLAVGEPAPDEIVGLVAATPVVVEGRPVPSAIWSRLCRQVGPVPGEEWGTRLADLGRHLDPAVAAEAVALRRFVAGFESRLALGRSARSWSERAAWAAAIVGDLLPGDGWPDAELAARAAVERVLADLATLDGGGRSCTAEAFATLASSELDRRPVPGRPLGDGLVVAPIGAVAGLPFERVVVVGVADGVFPRSVRDDSLLPDALRAESNGLLAPADAVTDLDVRAIAAALAASRRPGLITMARGDLRSIRSRSWPRSLDGLVDGRSSVASHHRMLADHGRPPSIEAFGLRALIDHVDGGEPVHSHVLAHRDPVLAANLQRVRARARGELNRHVGRIAAGWLDPSERLLSATALEAYAACPRSYLFGRVFRLGGDEAPERADEIRPTDRGTLMHAVLERFVGESLDAGIVPAPGEPWSAERRERLTAILADEVATAQAQGITGGRVSTIILERRLRAELALFLDTDDALRAERRSTPVEVEYGFGLGTEPSHLQLGDGRTVQLRGRVDRIDATEDGGLLVIDYKGSSVRAFTGMDADPLDGGRRLQLPLYARIVAGHLGRSGPRTALYWLTRAGQLRTVELEPEIEAAVDRTVGAALDGIAEGLFPAIPGEAVGWPRLTFANCRYCDFDRICPTDRQREWESIKGDGALAPVEVMLTGASQP